MKGHAYICDVCGHSVIAGSVRPKGWEQLRIPKTVELKRKGKHGRTHAVQIRRFDCCEFCVNAFLDLVDKRKKPKL